jgi:hypothetical protein
MNNNFHHLINTNNELNSELKNLVSSYYDDDIVRQRYHQNKIRDLLLTFIDEINMAEILPEYFLQIRFAKRYDFYNKEPLDFANFD